MKIESLLRQTMPLKDHRIKQCKKQDGKIIVEIVRRARAHMRCPGCGKKAVLYGRLPQRRWRHVPIYNITVEVVYAPHRTKCQRCGVKVEAMDWNIGKCQ